MNRRANQLLDQTAELSRLYPEMRFGQLVCFAATLAEDNPSGLPQDAEDEKMLDAIQRHIQRCSRRMESADNHAVLALPETLAELIEELRQLLDDAPQRELGLLLHRLAANWQVDLYDMEDEQLLQAARSIADQGSG